MRFFRTTPLGLALIISACTPGTPTARQWTIDDERSVRLVDSTYVSAWLRDDTTAVMGTLASDVVLMPAGQRPLESPNAVRAFWWPTDGSHTKILTFKRTIDEINGEGNVAWVRGTDTLTYSFDKGQTHSQLGSRSMTLAIWRRQPDGSWRISRMMWGIRGP